MLESVLDGGAGQPDVSVHGAAGVVGACVALECGGGGGVVVGGGVDD